jgi:hypothetical protein
MLLLAKKVKIGVANKTPTLFCRPKTAEKSTEIAYLGDGFTEVLAVKD